MTLIRKENEDILVSEVNFNGRKIKANSPVKFKVYFNSRLKHYEVEGPVKIISSEKTIQDLKESLELELAMLWDNYVDIKSSNLTKAACALKKKLKEIFYEENGGSRSDE